MTEPPWAPAATATVSRESQAVPSQSRNTSKLVASAAAATSDLATTTSPTVRSLVTTISLTVGPAATVCEAGTIDVWVYPVGG